MRSEKGLTCAADVIIFLLVSFCDDSDMARKTPPSDVKILYSEAAGYCSFPGCGTKLVVESKKGNGKKQIGKIAHIIAHSPNGPRADASYPKEKLDTYDNWILLCGTHHDLIDTLDSDYSVEDLRQMKAKHEAWVMENLEKKLPDVTFVELGVAIKAIMSSEVMKTTGSFQVTPPNEKISKNNLTAHSHNLIVQGLSRSHQVSRYISDQSKLDEDYPKRLIKGFRDEYDKLVQDGLEGDDLFKGMLAFACGGITNFDHMAAGLAILSHLFELCEVFER